MTKYLTREHASNCPMQPCVGIHKVCQSLTMHCENERQDTGPIALQQLNTKPHWSLGEDRRSGEGHLGQDSHVVQDRQIWLCEERTPLPMSTQTNPPPPPQITTTTNKPTKKPNKPSAIVHSISSAEQRVAISASMHQKSSNYS